GFRSTGRRMRRPYRRFSFIGGERQIMGSAPKIAASAVMPAVIPTKVGKAGIHCRLVVSVTFVCQEAYNDEDDDRCDDNRAEYGCCDQHQ
ncbi:MAG: hypothetical protein JXD18_00895, partial [Anaerolineae bacterium]|nr:hypothetical protein [Anaerolineae bacterium]